MSYSQVSLDVFSGSTEKEISNPEDFVKYVEATFELDEDYVNFIKLIRKGTKADRSFAKSRNGIKPGDWIVRPYDQGLVSVLRKAIEKGRLVEKW